MLFRSTQIAIGDNLLIHPWIDTVVRLNNSFIVKRNVPVRQVLEDSRKLSAYIRHTLEVTKESIWIAQREGRAKDSDNHTQRVGKGASVRPFSLRHWRIAGRR